MFWGCSVTSSRSVDLKSAAKKGEVLHISQAVLQLGKSEGPSTLFLTQGKDKFPLARLDHSKSTSSLDLYFEVVQGGVFSVEGKGEISVLGYFEPSENEPRSKNEMERGGF